MTAAKEVILITAGDPASISTEITIKALGAQNINKNINLVAITNLELVEYYKNLIRSNVKINEIKDEIKFSDYKNNYLNIIPIKLNNKVEYGKPDVKSFSFTKYSIIKVFNKVLTLKSFYFN